MPTPISQNPSDDPETRSEESSQTMDDDLLESPSAERVLAEVSPLEADTSLDETETTQDEPVESGKGSGRLALVLTVLLLASVAINLLQWRAQTRVVALADDYEVALTMAVEKLDEQTVRALSAEGTLSNVDTAMDSVRDRIAGLQEALAELATATEQ